MIGATTQGLSGLRRWGRCAAPLAASCLLPLLAGCATTEVVAPSPPQVVDRAYLLSPMLGLEEDAEVAVEEMVQAAHARLLEGDLEAARAAAEALARTDGDVGAVRLLWAQIDLATEEWSTAQRRVAPLLDPPGYVAAEVLAARAAERLGRVVEAYGLYRRAQGAALIARRRASDLRPRAVEIVMNRIRDDLSGDRLEEAETELARLAVWEAQSTETLELERTWAVAAERPERELGALRGLAQRRTPPPPERRRRAELEATVGDAGVAVEMLQELSSGDPHDPHLRVLLSTARFRWRLDLLPARVRELAAVPVLSRAQFAALVYWLVPRVRTLDGGRGRIASDVLEHDLQREVVRVVNLGLIDIQTSRHAFLPDRPVTRATALKALLRLLAASGESESCTGGAGFGGAVPSGTICDAAAACRILTETATCLAGATLSGSEAVDLIARTLAGRES